MPARTPLPFAPPAGAVALRFDGAPCCVRLELAPYLRGALVSAALHAGEREACGLLLGARERISEWVELANVSPDPRRAFELGPGEIVAAAARARALGLAWMAVWHSHPWGEAEPSRADHAGAWPGLLQVIVAPRAPRGATLRAFEFTAGGAQEVELVSPGRSGWRAASVGSADTRACRAGRP